MLTEEKNRAPGILTKSNYKPKKYVNLVRWEKKGISLFSKVITNYSISLNSKNIRTFVLQYNNKTENLHWVLSASVSLRYADSQTVKNALKSLDTLSDF